MPATVLCTSDSTVNKIDKDSCTHEAFVVLGKHTCKHMNKSINKVISDAKGCEENETDH